MKLSGLMTPFELPASEGRVRIHLRSVESRRGGKNATITSMIPRIVLDTGVFVSATLGVRAAHSVVRACAEARCRPLMGGALMLEYETVLSDESLFTGSSLTAAERADLLDLFLACCDWIRVYIGHQPNLPDAEDSHLVELAVAGGAELIVTHNVGALAPAVHQFQSLHIVTADKLMEEICK